ncbi:MAG: MFS transporter, partial [Burkholderiales bacterium]
FFTCGFHVAFIVTHLPGYVALCSLPATVSAWSLAVVGLFNIGGSLWIGMRIQTWRMKMSLAGIYAARAAIILVFFLFAPKTAFSFLVFSAAIGFTYLSTVPPTVGLVAKLHGPKYLATLFGVVMLSHQVGGFLGAWLGGKVFVATGNYDLMWWTDIALCLFAAAINLPIREARRPVAAVA